MAAIMSIGQNARLFVNGRNVGPVESVDIKTVPEAEDVRESNFYVRQEVEVHVEMQRWRDAKLPLGDLSGFQAAILANPHDDAPLLIYADWLEEQGNSPAAEAIRAVCRRFGGLRDTERIVDICKGLERVEAQKWRDIALLQEQIAALEATKERIREEVDRAARGNPASPAKAADVEEWRSKSWGNRPDHAAEVERIGRQMNMPRPADPAMQEKMRQMDLEQRERQKERERSKRKGRGY